MIDQPPLDARGLLLSPTLLAAESDDFKKSKLSKEWHPSHLKEFDLSHAN